MVATPVEGLPEANLGATVDRAHSAPVVKRKEVVQQCGDARLLVALAGGLVRRAGSLHDSLTAGHEHPTAVTTYRIRRMTPGSPVCRAIAVGQVELCIDVKELVHGDVDSANG